MPFAGFVDESGSSFSRETLREEEMPDGDDDLDVCPDAGDEDARDASSRESRAL